MTPPPAAKPRRRRGRTVVGGALVFVFALLAFGLAGERPPGPPVALRWIVLHDIQGLHGGDAVWISSDRTAIVQRVGRGGPQPMWEQRYRYQLTVEQWAEVERLVGASRLQELSVRRRQGVPEQAHPLIALETADCVTNRVGKLDGDTHPAFDPVYHHLLLLCRPPGEPTHEGKYDWAWTPLGFAPLW